MKPIEHRNKKYLWYSCPFIFNDFIFDTKTSNSNFTRS